MYLKCESVTDRMVVGDVGNKSLSRGKVSKNIINNKSSKSIWFALNVVNYYVNHITSWTERFFHILALPGKKPIYECIDESRQEKVFSNVAQETKFWYRLIHCTIICLDNEINERVIILLNFWELCFHPYNK